MDTSDLLSRSNLALNSSVVEMDYRARAYRAFAEREVTGPRDERFWEYYGLLALLMDDLDGAERILSRALSLPWASTSTQTSALYNLACVHARRGRETACRRTLEHFLSLTPTPSDRFPLATDEDFDQMRSKSWFADIVVRYAA
jgi:hypothetical protein